jgi:hypothetical protein
MPTGDEFRAAAWRLRRAAESASHAEFRVRTASYSTGVVGGQLESIVDRALMAAQVMAGDLEAACLDAEEECLARAAVCDAYASEFASWQGRQAAWEELSYQDGAAGGRVTDPGPQPLPPVKPVDWVELP